MFNRLFSLIGLSWGNGSMTVDGPSEPPSFPPFGTIINTVTTEYPISAGGSYFDYNGTNYPNQVATVNIVADGVGGTFYDWANATGISYKGDGVYVTNYTSYSSPIIINGTDYGAGCTYTGDVYHNGSGGYYEAGTGGSCTPYGTFITSVGSSGSNGINTPVGYFVYESWTGLSYYHDGMGGTYANYDGFTAQPDGTFIGTDSTGGSNQTEVPSGSGNYFTYSSWSSIDYYFQLSGYTYTYYYQGVTSANYGDFITNDGTYDYYWDGNGGYYT